MSISVLSRTRSFFSVMAVIVFSAMVLVGCGGGDEGDDGDGGGGGGGSKGITEADVATFVLGPGEAWVNEDGDRGVVYFMEQSKKADSPYNSNPKYKRFVVVAKLSGEWQLCPNESESAWYIDDGGENGGFLKNAAPCTINYEFNRFELNGNTLTLSEVRVSGFKGTPKTFTKTTVGALWEP